jgi:hypothetical protein
MLQLPAGSRHTLSYPLLCCGQVGKQSIPRGVQPSKASLKEPLPGYFTMKVRQADEHCEEPGV